MGQVLGLGLSHYPGPLVPVQHWPRMLARNVKVGRIPPQVYADRDGWPAAMRAEWGQDQGQAAAVHHRDRLLAGYATLRGELDAFAPDLVLVFGDDQFENFRLDGVPAFCAYLFDEITCRPYGGGGIPFETDQNAFDLPADTPLTVRGHRAAAHALVTHLLGEGFDLAWASTTRHPAGLAHSFSNTVLFLDLPDAGRGFRYPLIPIHVNCYGGQLLSGAARGAGADAPAFSTPPSPTPARCYALGAAIGRFLADSPWRVAIVASSSWSHGSLTAKHQRLYPDVEADRRLRADLGSDGWTRWGALSRDAIEDAGQHEVLNWICLAGAMAALGQRPQVVDFVESWVFNSSKCFALFPPG
ncbi:MAG: extradiol ring-cleavage dioxygenase [Immundisolibacter sp.]|uniref:extradiol ring-cleavage dioxygenase n=1 Tax=Immundisolibacter sp. TaxID=1934948 RepID=UPI003EE12AF4